MTMKKAPKVKKETLKRIKQVLLAVVVAVLHVVVQQLGENLEQKGSK
jgi:hypothetical protein